ncbi:hypothetical protein J3F83DRAFT_509884 [Trichoderma novae-zelandiae]
MPESKALMPRTSRCHHILTLHGAAFHASISRTSSQTPSVIYHVHAAHLSISPTRTPATRSLQPIPAHPDPTNLVLPTITNTSLEPPSHHHLVVQPLDTAHLHCARKPAIRIRASTSTPQFRSPSSFVQRSTSLSPTSRRLSCSSPSSPLIPMPPTPPTLPSCKVQPPGRISPYHVSPFPRLRADQGTDCLPLASQYCRLQLPT